MAKKEKSKQQFFKKAEFDSYEAAKQVVDRAKFRNTLSWIGMALAVIGSIICLIHLSSEGLNDGFISGATIGMLFAIPAYILCGGLGRALRFAFSVAKWGWVIAPFPFDLITGLAGLFLGIGFFCLFPVIFSAMSFIEHNREYDAAKLFLAAAEANKAAAPDAN